MLTQLVVLALDRDTRSTDSHAPAVAYVTSVSLGSGLAGPGRFSSRAFGSAAASGNRAGHAAGRHAGRAHAHAGVASACSPASRCARAERRFAHLVHFNKLAHGGHVAAMEQPGVFVDQVRATLRSPR